MEADQEAARAEQVNDTINKILDALRSNGYEPALASKTSRATAPRDNQRGHLQTSLTDDKHQVAAVLIRPLFVSQQA